MSTRTVPYKLHIGRILALSDGVFAIVITLLVLHLSIPHLTRSITNEELLSQLGTLLPKFYAYLLSFFIIGKYWQIHTYLYRRIQYSTKYLACSNLLFLLFISFLPFPTQIVGEIGNQVSIILFDICVALPALILMWAFRHIYFSKHYDVKVLYEREKELQSQVRMVEKDVESHEELLQKVKRRLLKLVFIILIRILSIIGTWFSIYFCPINLACTAFIAIFLNIS